MKSDKDSVRRRVTGNGRQMEAIPAESVFGRRWSGPDFFALAFGLFLGFGLIKFGNPIILESKIIPPKSWWELLHYPWPPSWSVWLFIPFAFVGLGLAFRKRNHWPGSPWLWLLPVTWFGWQLLSALRTADPALTAATLWHFGGCLTGYFVGALLLGEDRRVRLLLLGLLAALAFCLVRASNQKLFEFPQEKQFLMESERKGWTNLPPEVFLEMKQDGVIITTNGLDVVNPVIIAKYTKGRVHGTLVYPNAMAGAVLLLWPVGVAMAFHNTRRFRRLTRAALIVITLFLGPMVLVWTGSKSGWLIAMVLGAVWLFRLNWSARAKGILLISLIAVGLVVFGIRFRDYFARGATSVGARFDYWRAAVKNTLSHPILGSGPGTFQRPYERLKAPEAEMARLTHNDYLEQFSDSGIVGGLAYLSWIVLLLATLARRVWRITNPLYFALFLGLLGWFIQGTTEFSLYIPALAWPAFVLAGCLLRVAGNQIDKTTPPHLISVQ